jgi:hypothetical protein
VSLSLKIETVPHRSHQPRPEGAGTRPGPVPSEGRPTRGRRERRGPRPRPEGAGTGRRPGEPRADRRARRARKPSGSLGRGAARATVGAVPPPERPERTEGRTRVRAPSDADACWLSVGPGRPDRSRVTSGPSAATGRLDALLGAEPFALSRRLLGCIRYHVDRRADRRCRAVSCRPLPSVAPIGVLAGAGPRPCWRVGMHSDGTSRRRRGRRVVRGPPPPARGVNGAARSPSGACSGPDPRSVRLAVLRTGPYD